MWLEQATSCDCLNYGQLDDVAFSSAGQLTWMDETTQTERPLVMFAPNVDTSPKHAATMLGNPTSLALSLVAIATFVCARALNRFAAKPAVVRFNADRLQKPRRRAA